MSYDGDQYMRHFVFEGAREIVLLNKDGVVVRSSLQKKRAYSYAELVLPLAEMARNVVRDLDPSNDLCILRMHSENREVIVAPDTEFTLIVVHNLKFKKKPIEY